MGSNKSYYSRSNFRFLLTDQQLQAALSRDSPVFELDESDIYNNYSVSSRPDSPEFLTSRLTKKPSMKRGGGGDFRVGGTPASLPVNIPDWSKILKEEYRDRWRRSERNNGDVEGGDRIPPHEFLAKQMARTRIVSFSIHEGRGRTLKGRDLRSVRNAIFEKTGFQD
ncbi:hypothetical protein F3Y22_tig00009499pilonHSYRG00006 [Hibiscus syriacus]|uniref:Senescence regulator S40 n=1 Tax=Hibiscus syriacus TaxID=106335 RepID=A0A6A3C6J4_HIBSY|nr:uncharacterized protein LOC120203251 [Hibiscus syriacus]KAE8724885.1 hypothetical protein F3Y22_tig00009499pilonHSYRG00006 [Hibiscus syriacus]